jgi:hypothetical protein
MKELKQIVAFCILMENNKGILGKSPDYIMEKYNTCRFLLDPTTILDKENKAKFEKWHKRWEENND